jgi:hypothetical protein
MAESLDELQIMANQTNITANTNQNQIQLQKSKTVTRLDAKMKENHTIK